MDAELAKDFETLVRCQCEQQVSGSLDFVPRFSVEQPPDDPLLTLILSSVIAHLLIPSSSFASLRSFPNSSQHEAIQALSHGLLDAEKT